MTDRHIVGQGMSRRGFLHGAAALGVAGGGLGAVLSACGGGGTGTSGSPGAASTARGGTTELTYWNWFAGAGGAYMTKMVDAFNKDQKKVQVKATVYQLADYVTKLTSSTAVNKGPDAAALKVSNMPGFVSHDLLTPIDEGQLAKHGLHKSDFPAASWNASHLKGKLYGVPIDTEALVFYYNTKLCGAAGLLGSNQQLKPLVGKDAFISALQAGRAAGAEFAIGLDYTAAWGLWESFYAQLNGKIVSSDGKKVQLDDGKGVQAAQLVQQLGAGDKLSPLSSKGSDVATLFAEGKAAFLIGFPAAFVDFVKTRKTPFDVTYFPKIFNRQVSTGDTSTLVIPRHRNESSDHVDAVLSFIAGAVKHSNYWAEGGHIPDYLPVRQTKEFKSLLPQNHYAKVADHVAYPPTVSYLDELSTKVSPIWEGVFTGHSTASAGYQQFKSQVEQLAKKA